MTLNDLFAYALERAVDEGLEEPVAECDVCHRGITRAEAHVGQALDVAFGCITCTMERYAAGSAPVTPSQPATPRVNGPAAPVTLKRPVLDRPVATERAEPKPQREKRTRAPKAAPAPAAPPEEPAPAIELEPSVSPEDAPYLEPGKPLAPPRDETHATCDICGRGLPTRLLAMHRANCERAAKGLT